jgi:signal transduction histidine kinase
MFRAWRIRLYAIAALFGFMLIILIINGILLLQADHVWPAVSQSLAMVILVIVSSFLYHRVWLEIQRRRILREVSDTLSGRGSLNEFLDQVVHAGLQLFPLSDRCAIHLLDESGQNLHLSSSSAPRLAGQQVIPASQGIASEILRDLKPQLILDTRQVPGPLPIDPRPGRGCLVVVPLQAQDKPLGLLSLYSHIPGAFARQDRLLLWLLGNLASAAIDRARLTAVSLGETGQMEDLIGDLTDGVVIMDHEDRILYYSASLAPLLGADTGEIVGQKVDVQSEDAGVRRLAALLACAPSGAGGYHEFQAQLEDPFHGCFLVYVSPALDQQGQWKQIIILHDQTAEIDKIRAQDDLMSATLQESGPPLRSLRSYAALLQNEEMIGASTMPWAGLMRDHTIRLMRLVHGLQDVSAIQEKGLPLNTEVTPLWPLVKDVLGELAEPAQRAGVSFDLSFPADLSSILCDPDRLRYVLFFVLDNALHRGISGGRIGLGVKLHCAHLLFSVTDDGRPITDSTWERIQRGLSPSRESAREDPSDTGLGLYLGRKLVEAHGGHLWMGPPAERGATLYFVLPYQPIAADEQSRSL